MLPLVHASRRVPRSHALAAAKDKGDLREWQRRSGAAAARQFSESGLGDEGASVRAPERLLESSLYLPVKRFLERLGFEVKGEVCGCDLVALDAKEPTAVVVGGLKLTFTLDLVLRAVDRLAACDEVWLAVRASRRGRGREHDRRVRKLCRLLGFGLLSVASSGKVEVLVEPVPWR